MSEWISAHGALPQVGGDYLCAVEVVTNTRAIVFEILHYSAVNYVFHYRNTDIRQGEVANVLYWTHLQLFPKEYNPRHMKEE